MIVNGYEKIILFILQAQKLLIILIKNPTERNKYPQSILFSKEELKVESIYNFVDSDGDRPAPDERFHTKTETPGDDFVNEKVD